MPTSRAVCFRLLQVRSHYDDDMIAEMAKIAANHQLFGGVCTETRVLKEFQSYSDFQLHCFSHNHYMSLGQYLMPPSCVMASAKFTYLKDLLASLKQKGEAWRQHCNVPGTCTCSLILCI